MLTVAYGGEKLGSPDQSIDEDPTDSPVHGSFFATNGTVNATKVSMSDFAGFLSSLLQEPVVNGTGINGYYSFKTAFFLHKGEAHSELPGEAKSEEGSSPRFVFDLKRLGLKLETRKMPVEYLVVVHADRTPTEN